MQKRSPLKDYAPGFWDLTTGGVVGQGESDEINAQRELAEELGLKEGQLDFESHGTFKFEGETKVFANMFIVRNFDPE